MKKQDNYIISLMNQVTFLQNKDQDDLNKKPVEKPDSPNQKQLKSILIYNFNQFKHSLFIYYSFTYLILITFSTFSFRL